MVDWRPCPALLATRTRPGMNNRRIRAPAQAFSNSERGRKLAGTLCAQAKAGGIMPFLGDRCYYWVGSNTNTRLDVMPEGNFAATWRRWKDLEDSTMLRGKGLKIRSDLVIRTEGSSKDSQPSWCHIPTRAPTRRQRKVGGLSTRVFAALRRM